MTGTGTHGGQTRRSAGLDVARPAWVARVEADGSAAHRLVALLAQRGDAETTRTLADALHHLCLLHGRYPGVVDKAAEKVADSEVRRSLFELADAFGGEREALANLVVAAGPIPSTPGQAETQATVLAQRHALETLGGSDRAGCGVGAALALALDWQAVRWVFDSAARRFGVTLRPTTLPDTTSLVALAGQACSEAGSQRALLFAAEQIAAQHRGLWDLLDVRAKARTAQ